VLKPYQPDDALKLIEVGRLKRTLVRVQNGAYRPVPNVDEEAIDNYNLRVHTEEDQPAAIQVEDDEQVAYYDEATGYFYDCDGFVIDVTRPDSGSMDGDAEAMDQAELMNAQDDLTSAIELMNRNKLKSA